MNSTQHPWTPRFEPGQVVTHDDLNQLHDVLSQRDRFAARHLSGHGILFGLRVTQDVENRTWVVQPGAAIDRMGRVLLVTEPTPLSPCHLPPVEDGVHPHIRPDPAVTVPNFTPVLVRRDLECVGEGQEAEAGRRRVSAAEIRLFPGRVQPRTAPEYGLTPLRLPHGLRIPDGARFNRDFELRRVRLHDLVGGTDAFGGSVCELVESLALSEQLQIGVPTGGDLLRVAILNEVIVTLWQWARAGQYLDLHLDHASTPWPAEDDNDEEGVPLGWMVEDPREGWVFDNRWRGHFTIGLSRLEHVVGYSPEGIREICVERLQALADAARTLRPLQARDAPHRNRIGVDTWTLTPDQVAGGTSAWLRPLRFDRPRKEASFWPLDPLRTPTQSPGHIEPYPRAHDPRPKRPEPHVRCPAPWSVDPVNDPFAFSAYAEPTRLDRWNVGMVALAGLLEFPVDEVRAALASQEGPEGRALEVELVALGKDDEDALRDVEIVLLASRRETIVVIHDEAGTVVACGIRTRPRGPRPANTRAPLTKGPGFLAGVRTFFREVLRGLRRGEGA